MPVRDHKEIPIEDFYGLYQRGKTTSDADACPIDHFKDCNNIQFAMREFSTRDGIDTIAGPGNVVRMYRYKSPTLGEGLISLNTDGEFIHTTYGPDASVTILTVALATDFAFVEIAGRAYISPITGLHGSVGEFLYVYFGDGVAARKAAGATPAGTLAIANGAAGHTDAGLHTFGVVGETDSGYLSAPIALNNFVTSAGLSISFSSIPTFSGSQWVKRHIVASRVIEGFNGDNSGYQFYFIPNATINDNTTTVLANQSFYDIELIDDASHLIDNFAEIPAGAVLNTYNGRLVIANGDFGEGVVYLSAPGEPEAIDQVDGALTPPYSTEHVTNAQEYRDVLYIFKKNRTFAYMDNGDVPVLWSQPTIIDNGIGCGFHGIGTILDSNGINVEFMFVAHSSGFYQFAGTYINPELSWKIETFWAGIDGSDNHTQVLVNSIDKRIYIVTQTGRMLMADFVVDLNFKKIKWTPWSFDIFVTTIAIFEGPRLLLGASGLQ